MDDAAHLWDVCTKALREQVSEASWRTWFAEIRPVGVEDDVLVLAVPNPILKQRLDGLYAGDLQRAVDAAGGVDLSVAIVIDPSMRSPTESTPDAAVAQAPSGPHIGQASAEPAGAVRTGHAAGGSPAGDGGEAGLNPRYTFDAFVIGSSNRFAHAAALSVAETPARSYNPLFIYGRAGLGKTHLLHAIGHYVQVHYRGFRVRYLSTETFTNEFIDAIRTNTTTEFKRRYRDCELLLIDDIQFIEGKESTQEEFFHTFNSLHGANRQIVISSDRSPDAIPTLEDRLRSRFKWGLTTDIQPPELETRLAILHKKAEKEASRIDDAVLELIATHVKDNIRELEGALNRVIAYASLNREPLTVDLAHQVLSDLLSGDEPRPITPADILEATATTFGFSVEDLTGKSRRRPLVTARQIGMYVFRQLTDYSFPAIGREFGGRDHTTVMHAVEKVSALMKERRAIYDQVAALMDTIKKAGS